ncbi:MAG TPA: NUDIX domain-containing protein [Oligoflexia bacterium]|nr:NUDIX domain-containing protein [Oligoflexia bacterium]HMP47116.1 NUDIX domain-containing protein [Oligoflexia bacterium]
MTKQQLPFRKNVAAFVLNPDGLILVCKRADRFKDWQLPQGGIDSGETPEEAIKRELKEEIGLHKSSIKIISCLDTPISYTWPKELHERGYIGQEQYFFLIQSPPNWTPDFEIAPEKEFEDYIWADCSMFLSKIESTFREKSYKEALLQFLEIRPDLIKK